MALFAGVGFTWKIILQPWMLLDMDADQITRDPAGDLSE